MFPKQLEQKTQRSSFSSLLFPIHFSDLSNVQPSFFFESSTRPNDLPVLQSGWMMIYTNSSIAAFTQSIPALFVGLLFAIVIYYEEKLTSNMCFDLMRQNLVKVECSNVEANIDCKDVCLFKTPKFKTKCTLYV